MLFAGAVVLRLMGRVWWCREEDLAPWAFDIWSPHNSQHLLDPYAITHVLHGVALYGALWLLMRGVLSAADRGLVAIALELVWEVVENTPMVIDRYRETTVSLNYYGDSVVNSIGDTLAFAGGYALAAVIPASVSAVGFFVVDALLLLWIRDSLLLNMLMLVYPIDAIKSWQLGERDETVRASLAGLATLSRARPTAALRALAGHGRGRSAWSRRARSSTGRARCR